MYFEIWGEPKAIFYRHKDPKPTAKKEHECCECGRTIKAGEKYDYFVGCWEDDYNGKDFGVYKTCLECDKDWSKILNIFWRRGELEACRVFCSLKDAVQEAFDAGYLTENDRLVQEWLGIFSEVAVLENIKEHEKQEAVAQMRAYSRPIL